MMARSGRGITSQENLLHRARLCLQRDAATMAKIFVIEDDRTIAELLQAALQHDGDEVCLSLQGKLDALDEPYDLVLLDLILPDADGLVLALQIRGTDILPIIILTAPCELGVNVACFGASPD